MIDSNSRFGCYYASGCPPGAWIAYGEMSTELPLHVVCDYSDEDLIYITTVYIPSREEWIHNFQRRKRSK